MTGSSVTRIDHGMNRIMGALGQLPKGAVMVGWPGKGPKHKKVERSTTKAGKKRAKASSAESSMTIAQIAVIHEFGAPAAGIPARPVMQETNRRSRDKLNALRIKLVREIYRGQITPEQALKQMGVFWEGEIKSTFRRGTFNPLKAATIKAKGSSQPLIDSGQLRNSVTSRVVPA